MRRFSLVAALTATLLVAMVLPALAAPSNGNSARELTLDCEGGTTVEVLVQWETESAVAFDIERGNGRQYVLSFIHFVVTAPDGTVVVDDEKTWGKRKGYNETLECEGSSEDVDPEGNVFTAVFTVVLASK